MRARLPDRRPAIAESLVHNGKRVHLRAGIDPRTGRLAELFIRGGKTGSDADSIHDVIAILISRCIQHGDTIAELRHAVGTQTIAGPALDWMLQLEAESARTVD